MKLYILTSGDMDSLTGGYLYNKRLAEGIKGKGGEVQMISLAASNPADIEKAGRIQFGKIPSGSWVMVDSLVLGMLNRVIRDNNHKFNLVGLVHLPATFDPLKRNKKRTLAGYELEAMAAVRHLIVTGRFMMQYLLEAGVKKGKISLVEPGVDDFPRKKKYAGSPYELLCISNYSAIKAQNVLINALSRLKMRNWTLRLYGDLKSGAEYVNSLKSNIIRKKLQNRIWLYDALDRDKISAAFLQADLFVLPSLFESYGMVLTESLAHGIPVVTTTAGNIRNTVPATMGMFSEPGNVNELTGLLDGLFMDPKKYRLLCEAAAGYYRQARSWEKAVEEIAEIIR